MPIIVLYLYVFLVWLSWDTNSPLHSQQCENWKATNDLFCAFSISLFSCSDKPIAFFLVTLLCHNLWLFSLFMQTCSTCFICFPVVQESCCWLQVWLYNVGLGSLVYRVEKICDGSGEDPSCSRLVNLFCHNATEKYGLHWKF